MKYRFIKYEGKIYLVRGFAYNTMFEPPECYVAVPLEYKLFNSLISLSEVHIPFSKANEVNSLEAVKCIILLYGISDDREV